MDRSRLSLGSSTGRWRCERPDLLLGSDVCGRNNLERGSSREPTSKPSFGNFRLPPSPLTRHTNRRACYMPTWRSQFDDAVVEYRKERYEEALDLLNKV